MLYTLESPTPEAGGFFGCSIAAAGDLDENGSDDVIIGAVFENPGESPQDAGRAHVVFTESQAVDNRPGASVLPNCVRLVSVSPNPATDHISVLYAIEKESPFEGAELTLRIHDLSGRLVATQTDLESNNGTHSLVWPLRREIIPSGLYVLTLFCPKTEVSNSSPLVFVD